MRKMTQRSRIITYVCSCLHFSEAALVAYSFLYYTCTTPLVTSGFPACILYIFLIKASLCYLENRTFNYLHSVHWALSLKYKDVNTTLRSLPRPVTSIIAAMHSDGDGGPGSIVNVN